MIELVTGLPGSGKTLSTICRIKDKAEREGRPVYYSGIPGVTLPWIELDDATQWHTLPANSIVVIDEAQRVFRPRGNGSSVPEHVEKLETHRHQGIDLVLLTQHPMLVESNVRRLCGSHYHVARPFGWSKAKILRFESVRDQPLSKIAEATVTVFKYPPEAFAWYKSAEVHTHKKRIPWQYVAFFVLPVFIIGAFGWFFWSKLHGTTPAKSDAPALLSGSPPESGGRGRPRLSTAQYLRDQLPRVAGLAYTAPAFDEVTKPVHAPYPAACVVMRGQCRCYSQQGTRLDTPDDLCRSVVDRGFFVSWEEKGAGQGARLRDTATRQPAEPERFSGIAIAAPEPSPGLSESPKQPAQSPASPRVPASSPWSGRS